MFFLMNDYEYDSLDWLVLLTILKNMKVNGKDDIPYIMQNKKNVWKHQSAIWMDLRRCP